MKLIRVMNSTLLKYLNVNLKILNGLILSDLPKPGNYLLIRVSSKSNSINSSIIFSKRPPQRASIKSKTLFVKHLLINFYNYFNPLLTLIHLNLKQTIVNPQFGTQGNLINQLNSKPSHLVFNEEILNPNYKSLKSNYI